MSDLHQFFTPGVEAKQKTFADDIIFSLRRIENNFLKENAYGYGAEFQILSPHLSSYYVSKI